MVAPSLSSFKLHGNSIENANFNGQKVAILVTNGLSICTDNPHRLNPIKADPIIRLAPVFADDRRGAHRYFCFAAKVSGATVPRPPWRRNRFSAGKGMARFKSLHHPAISMPFYSKLKRILIEIIDWSVCHPWTLSLNTNVTMGCPRSRAFNCNATPM